MRLLKMCALLAGCVLHAVACTPPQETPVEGAEAPPDNAYPKLGDRGQGFKQNPNFIPAPPPQVATQRRALRADGEVLVIEGDDRFVTSGVGGGFGIIDANQVAIVQEVLSMYPDVFDTIQIYLSFQDEAAGSSAYYQGIKNDVAGIGRDTFNGRQGWGLPLDGRLSGFSNMNSIDQFGGMQGGGVPRSGYHAVIAQELSHRWLFYMTFRDAIGDINEALLGRDNSHWSRLAQANGSVQDGNDWMDNNDGSFTLLGSDYAFAPLDRYAMGIIPAGAVPPLYYLVETTLDGMPIDEDDRIPNGARIRGRRIDVTIDQVVAALGPRDPPAGTETPYYRAAFVLVTRPGQAPQDYEPYLQALHRIQETFPETYRDWTDGAGAICTKVSERCPEPVIGVDRFRVEDGNDDLVAPGESFQLFVSVRNDGLGTAEGVQVTLEPLEGVQITSATIAAAPIPEGGAVELSMPFNVTADAAAVCGGTIRMQLKATTREGPEFKREMSLVVGNETVRIDYMNEAPNWTVNPDGDDTATAGQWELGAPDLVSVLGVLTQPGEDHSPGEAKLSFHTGPERGGNPFVNDVDGGKTTLETPIFAAAGTDDPSLVFWGWFVAENFAAMGGPQPVPGAAMIVLGSNDGGESWTEMLTISERTPKWTRYAVRIREFLQPTNRMRFRFVINDPTPNGTVEGGVDDLEIIDVLGGCAIGGGPDGGVTDGGGAPKPEDEGGCGCGTSPSGGAGLSLLAGLSLFAILRRRS